MATRHRQANPPALLVGRIPNLKRHRPQPRETRAAPDTGVSTQHVPHNTLQRVCGLIPGGELSETAGLVLQLSSLSPDPPSGVSYASCADSMQRRVNTWWEGPSRNTRRLHE